MTKDTVLCKECQVWVFGILNELLAESQKAKRGNLIQDCVLDVWCCLEDGNLDRVYQRDRARRAGKQVPRRLTPNNAKIGKPEDKTSGLYSTAVKDKKESENVSGTAETSTSKSFPFYTEETK